jgi:hypothetical protein
VIWLALRYAGERARERERRGRFVEAQIAKFGEAREFVEFARSDAGMAWLRADSGEMQVRRGLLTLAVVGIFFLALGGALFVNAVRLAGGADPSDALSAAHDRWWGTMLVALGAGSVVSSLVIARLGREWELIPRGFPGAREADGE